MELFNIGTLQVENFCIQFIMKITDFWQSTINLMEQCLQLVVVIVLWEYMMNKPENWNLS
jgi:hypothetical protein